MMENIIEYILLAFALAMDCFTVSVVCGVIVRKFKAGITIPLAVLFGLFQAAMPLIGWLLTKNFSAYLQAVDHWIAFGLLAFIGGKMLADAFRPEDEAPSVDPSTFKSQVLLAIATSIDALAVGISFACTGFKEIGQLWTPLAIIGIVSFVMSLAGYFLGARFGSSFTKKIKPEVLGGLILIGIGVKVLIEHLGGAA